MIWLLTCRNLDGSTIGSHSDDGKTDPRLILVPRAHYPANSVRNVYWDPEDYPRYVGYERGPGYHPLPGQNVSIPIGSIPQVNTTYQLFEASYGLMNEYQVGMSESMHIISWFKT